MKPTNIPKIMKCLFGFIFIMLFHSSVKGQWDFSQSFDYLATTPKFKYYEFYDDGQNMDQFLLSKTFIKSGGVTTNVKYSFLKAGGTSLSLGVNLGFGVLYYSADLMLDINRGFLTERMLDAKKKVGYFVGAGIGVFESSIYETQNRVVDKDKIPANALIKDLDIRNLNSVSEVELRDQPSYFFKGVALHAGFSFRYGLSIILPAGIRASYHKSFSSNFDYYTIGLIWNYRM